MLCRYHSRQIKELIMKLHTGETLVKSTGGWTWVQRERLGQDLLLSLAKEVLNWNVPSFKRPSRYLSVAEFR